MDKMEKRILCGDVLLTEKGLTSTDHLIQKIGNIYFNLQRLWMLRRQVKNLLLPKMLLPQIWVTMAAPVVARVPQLELLLLPQVCLKTSRVLAVMVK